LSLFLAILTALLLSNFSKALKYLSKKLVMESFIDSSSVVYALAIHRLKFDILIVKKNIVIYFSNLFIIVISLHLEIVFQTTLDIIKKNKEIQHS
jgi:hypothetical protein